MITSCLRIIRALRIKRSHGMPPSAFHEVFRAVVVVELCYASSAWWGFSMAGDIQRTTAFIRRTIRQGCTDLADITSIIDRLQLITPCSAKSLPTQITS